MYEQLRTHIAIPHIANKSATKHSANNHYIRYQQQPYMQQTPAVYATNTHRIRRFIVPAYTFTTTKRHKHTRTQRIPNHETTTNIYGRDKSAPTPNGMYTNHSWNVRNTFRKIFDAI